MKTSQSKITPQKLPWVVLGIMIIVASFLQAITYYSYAKLDNAVQTFIADIREAKDDKEAEEIFTKFVGDSAPLIGTSDSGAFLGIGRLGRGIRDGVGGLFGGGRGGSTPAGPQIKNCSYKSCQSDSAGCKCQLVTYTTSGSCSVPDQSCEYGHQPTIE